MTEEKKEELGPVESEVQATEELREEFVTKDEDESNGADQAATEEDVSEDAVAVKSEEQDDVESDEVKMVTPPIASIPEWQLRKVRANGESVDSFNKRLAVIAKKEAEESEEDDEA